MPASCDEAIESDYSSVRRANSGPKGRTGRRQEGPASCWPHVHGCSSRSHFRPPAAGRLKLTGKCWQTPSGLCSLRLARVSSETPALFPPTEPPACSPEWPSAAVDLMDQKLLTTDPREFGHCLVRANELLEIQYCQSVIQNPFEFLAQRSTSR